MKVQQSKKVFCSLCRISFSGFVPAKSIWAAADYLASLFLGQPKLFANPQDITRRQTSVNFCLEIVNQWIGGFFVALIEKDLAARSAPFTRLIVIKNFTLILKRCSLRFPHYRAAAAG